MKKLIGNLGSSAAVWAVFILAAALLITGTIGGARAAGLTGLKNSYDAGLEVTDSVQMTIIENGSDVAEGEDTMLVKLAGEEEEPNIGQTYPEELRVRNSGGIDAYMRVIVYCYWTDADGNKRTDLDPSLIELELLDGGEWKIDTASSTRERTIIYHKGILTTGQVTAPFAATLKLSPDTNRHVTQTKDPATGYITTVYEYDGARFCIEIVVDAVQTHNAAAAIKSSWGVDAGALGILG
jgi:hypothetical protein